MRGGVGHAHVGVLVDHVAVGFASLAAGGGQQQGDAAEPAVGGKAVVGVGKVPDVVDDDVDPRHVGPNHIFLVLRGVDVPPGGHAEDALGGRRCRSLRCAGRHRATHPRCRAEIGHSKVLLELVHNNENFNETIGPTCESGPELKFILCIESPARQ